MLLKCLRLTLKSASGRNNQGCITVRGRKKKFKNFYYKVNYKNLIFNLRNTIIWLGKRPQNTGYLVLYCSGNSYFHYKIAVTGLSSLSGGETRSDFDARALVGNSMPLYAVPLTSDLNVVNMRKNCEGILSRAAGTLMRVTRKHSRIGFVTIKMPSKKLNYIKWDCTGTIGQVSNENNFLQHLNKAGVSFKNGFRPKVRGVAMNPVDHPLGGGEGKSSGGRPSCSPWGWLTKGPKTRNKSKHYFLLKLKARVNKFF